MPCPYRYLLLHARKRILLTALPDRDSRTGATGACAVPAASECFSIRRAFDRVAPPTVPTPDRIAVPVPCADVARVRGSARRLKLQSAALRGAPRQGSR